MIIPNIWKNKKCSKAPTSDSCNFCSNLIAPWRSLHTCAYIDLYCHAHQTYKPEWSGFGFSFHCLCGWIKSTLGIFNHPKQSYLAIDHVFIIFIKGWCAAFCRRCFNWLHSAASRHPLYAPPLWEAIQLSSSKGERKVGTCCGHHKEMASTDLGISHDVPMDSDTQANMRKTWTHTKKKHKTVCLSCSFNTRKIKRWSNSFHVIRNPTPMLRAATWPVPQT